MVYIQLLGTFHLKHSDESADGAGLAGVIAPRVQSLIAYLALHRQSAFSRHQLAFLLWPESSEEQALTNLRGELFKMRHQWPQVEEYIQIKRDSLQWRLQA